MNSNGVPDSTFKLSSGANDSILTTRILPNGKIVIGGVFTAFNGASRNRIAMVKSNGEIDSSFVTGTGFNASVYAIDITSTGLILVAGKFTSYNDTLAMGLICLNGDGSINKSINFGNGFNRAVRTIVRQSDGKLAVGGDFTTYDGQAVNRLIRLNSDGSMDPSFLVGTAANATVLAITCTSDGKYMIGGEFTQFNGTTVSRIVRLTSSGTVDGGFSSGSGADAAVRVIVEVGSGYLVAGDFLVFNNFVSRGLIKLYGTGGRDASFGVNFRFEQDGFVNAMVVQADFKIVLANNVFTQKMSDGRNDPNFFVGNGSNYSLSDVEILPNGKMLLGGDFTTYNGGVQNGLVRTHPDGTVDSTFNIGTGFDATVTTGFNSDVKELALQSDGKVLVAGSFTTFNGATANRLVRLNPNGTLDNSFVTGTGFDSDVFSVLVDANEKILVAGWFSTYNGAAVPRGIIRLNGDGSVDNSFNAGSGSPAGYVIYDIAEQQDGKILLSGSFNTFNNLPYSGLVRLNSNGSVDATFQNYQNCNCHVTDIVLQEDGKILIGGSFFGYNGGSDMGIARLNNNGSLDPSFTVGISLYGVSEILVQADDKIILGGSFQYVDGVRRNGLCRVLPDGSLDQSFEVGNGVNGGVGVIRYTSAGNILIAGDFSFYQDKPFNNMALLKGGNFFFSKIRGNIYADQNQSCTKQSQEHGLTSLIVKAEPGPYYGCTNELGDYSIKVDTGAQSYTLTQLFNPTISKLLVDQCPESKTVVLTGKHVDTVGFDFGNKIRNCALLNIEVSKDRYRRCFRGETFVSYCNNGNISASNVQVKIQFPPHVVPISSTPPWTSKNGSELIFDAGDLAASECNSIQIIDSIDCGDESIRGMTQCITATISPIERCESVNLSWDKSSIKVTGECLNGQAHFKVINSGSGNMASTSEYRVYLNDTLIAQDPFQLASGQWISLDYTIAGQTIRVEADQHPLHPGNSRPRATVEGCGDTSEFQFLASNAEFDDEDPEVELACGQIVDSYDPNDKRAVPAGYGPDNIVAPGTTLEYTVRFQNTGTDVAYHVMIVDTLDVALDPATIEIGAVSHPYTFSVTGKSTPVLTFDFVNINLPDSSTNEVGSCGAISYKVKVPSNTPLQTEIKNKAYIYFDYNSAIITNETSHKIDVTVPTDFSKASALIVNKRDQVDSEISYSLYPNPAKELLVLDLSNYQGAIFELFTLTGVLVKEIEVNAARSSIGLESIEAGAYMYCIKTVDTNQSGLLFIE